VEEKQGKAAKLSEVATSLPVKQQKQLSGNYVASEVATSCK
jgi:hypothetical protein